MYLFVKIGNILLSCLKNMGLNFLNKYYRVGTYWI